MIFSLGLETVGYEAHLFYLYTLSTTPLREDKSWVNNIDFAMACPRPNSRLTGRQDVNYHKSALDLPCIPYNNDVSIQSHLYFFSH